MRESQTSVCCESTDAPLLANNGVANIHRYKQKAYSLYSWKTNLMKTDEDHGDLIVFAGGMPRASYGDRNTVTAICGDYHVTFNLTSKIIDFCVVADEEAGHASCLVILAEEEIVFIDLDSEDWPAFASPYLACLHSSALTCSFLASNVSADIYDKIKEAGEKQQIGLSKRTWPINGGKLKNTDTPKQKDMLLTGHEDGTVQFWDASGVSLKLLYKLSTAQLFVSEDLGGDGAAAEDDDWPPFRKTGLFDPYSDDPRLGVKKMEMCPHTGTLVVAGTAGQILVLNLETEEKEIVPECVNVNLVAETDNFVWKSHNKLDMLTEAVKFSAGMQPTVVVQFYPPASCTSLTLHSEWGLVACGTAHGFALFDIIQKKNILSKSTLSPLDLANAADEGPMSRRKSLKKSLRESFRRLRRGRSQRKTGKPLATSPTRVEHDVISDTSDESHDDDGGASSPNEDESEVEEGEEEEFDMSDEGEGEQETEKGRKVESDREMGEETGTGSQVAPVERAEEAILEHFVEGGPSEDAEGVPVQEATEVEPGAGAEEIAMPTEDVAIPAAEVIDNVAQEAGDEDVEILEIDEQDLDGEHVLDNPSQEEIEEKEPTSQTAAISEQVPFFYYVTPKRFRESSKDTVKDKKDAEEKRKKEDIEGEGKGKSKFKLGQVFTRKEKMSTDEPANEEQEDNNVEQEQKPAGLFKKIFSRQASEQEESKDSEEQAPASPVTTPRGGVSKLKEWLQKREPETEMAKVEGVEAPESREGSLRRLFRRSRPTTLESPIEGEEQKSFGTKSPVDSQLSKRQRLKLALRQRHHSEEAQPPRAADETRPQFTLGEAQVKSRSLTRPSKLWLIGHSQSEKHPSPVVSEPSVPIESTDPRIIPTEESEPKKRKFFILPLRNLKGQEPENERAIQKSLDIYNIDERDSLQRTPSYERAISDNIIKSKISKGKSKGHEEEEGKLKKLIRMRSEIILRPFKKNKNQENRKSAPVPDVSVSKECEDVPDIEARHPSISTYIDDTPTAAVPPEIPPPDPESYSCPASAQPREMHETQSPKQLLSPDSEADSVVLDLHSLQSTPDVVRKVPDSRGSTLERSLRSRLTFSLPFGSAGGGGAASAEEEGVKPVERAIEARSQTSDYIGSMVRCLHLTKCFIANTQAMSATLWAGTNSGAIFVFTVAIPPSDKRSEITLTVQLGKEIHLKHGAPVISICILDGASRPFPEPMAVKKEAAPAANPNQPHRVLICSEEQFKVFTLPQLKPYCKYKLTAHEGSRVRKIGQVQESHIKKEDISGINSVVFSNRGEAIYMSSSCELERISLSAKHTTRALGTVPVLVKPKNTDVETPKTKPADDPAQDGEGHPPASPDGPATAPPTEEREAENETNKDKEEKETSEAVGGTSLKKLEDVPSVKENGDSSVLSGDITIDSIRDH
ncbi:Lethal(2) giant larvae protein 1, partial [Halocaridina rubra]